MRWRMMTRRSLIEDGSRRVVIHKCLCISSSPPLSCSGTLQARNSESDEISAGT